jgi:hypothetical protein
VIECVLLLERVLEGQSKRESERLKRQGAHASRVFASEGARKGQGGGEKKQTRSSLWRKRAAVCGGRGQQSVEEEGSMRRLAEQRGCLQRIKKGVFKEQKGVFKEQTGCLQRMAEQRGCLQRMGNPYTCHVHVHIHIHIYI